MNLVGNFWNDIFFAIIVFVVAVIIARVHRYIIGRLVKGASTNLKVDPTKYNFLKNAVEFIVYIINSSLSHENLCIFIEMGVSFDSDVDQAMRMLQEETMKHPDCVDNRTQEEIESGTPQVNVRLINITESAMQLRAYGWARNPSDGFNLKCDVLKNTKRRFDEAGISLAYPQRMVYIKETYREAVELYKKALSLGKNEAQDKITELEKKL